MKRWPRRWPEGITVSTVALGEDADRQLLSTIAEVGHGRFYETNDPANVPQIFTKETMEATKSAIKEDLYGSVQMGDHPILAGYHGCGPAVHARLRDDRSQAHRAAPAGRRNGRSAAGRRPLRPRHRHGLHQRPYRKVGRRVARLERLRQVLGSSASRRSAEKPPRDCTSPRVRRRAIGSSTFGVRDRTPRRSTEFIGARVRLTKTGERNRSRFGKWGWTI